MMNDDDDSGKDVMAQVMVWLVVSQGGPTHTQVPYVSAGALLVVVVVSCKNGCEAI